MKKRFLVVEDSFIGMTMIRAEDKKIVEIETDPELGGMTPSTNLVEVDENDEPIAVGAKKKKKAAAGGAPSGAGDLA